MTKAMRVAQATAWYPPRYMGGTEVYVAGLVRELSNFDIESVVITPDDQAGGNVADQQGAAMHTYPVPTDPNELELQRREPHAGFDQFQNMVTNGRLQVYHQHSWTRGLGHFHLKAAHDAGLRTVLTVHVGSFVCMRGTMMRFGQTPCDGRIVASDCTACWSHQRGAPKALSRLVASVPPDLGRLLLERRHVFGRLGTLMATSHLVEQKRRELLAATAHSDRIVAVCQWLYDALLLNGVPKAKLVLCRHGVDIDVPPPDEAVAPDGGGTAGPRFVYLGRSDPTKGAHILVEAAARVPAHVRFRLDLYCVGTEALDKRYKANLVRLAKGDPRIGIHGALARDQVAATLAHSEILAVPSICLETGPLVVLEAKSLGLKVLGSDLGGISESIDPPVDGYLVRPGDVPAWTKAIEMLALDVPSRDRHSRSILPRSMRDVAIEMRSVYESLF